MQLFIVKNLESDKFIGRKGSSPKKIKNAKPYTNIGYAKSAIRSRIKCNRFFSTTLNLRGTFKSKVTDKEMERMVLDNYIIITYDITPVSVFKCKEMEVK